MRLSRKLEAYRASIFTQLAQEKQALRADGMDVIDLSIGTPDLPPAPHIMRAISEAALLPENYVYAVNDRAALLSSVAAWYVRRFGVTLCPNTQITSLLGSQDGLAHIAQALLDVGDTVLVPDPCYPIFADGPALCGMCVERLEQRPENGYRIDFDAVPEAVARRAKLLIFSYPNNPVASVVDQAYFEKVVAFAKRYDLAVVHDNAYCELTFDGYRCGSFLQTPGAMDVGVEFNSLSKTYNMAGARIGFALGNAHIISLLKSLKSNIDFGVFLPIQLAAQAALDGPQDQVEETRRTYARRRDVLLDGLTRIGWPIEKPMATMFVWAKIPAHFSCAQTFARELMQKTGVIVVPGTAFGACGEGHVRMALVQPEHRLLEVVDRISRSGLLSPRAGQTDVC